MGVSLEYRMGGVWSSDWAILKSTRWAVCRMQSTYADLPVESGVDVGRVLESEVGGYRDL